MSDKVLNTLLREPDHETNTLRRSVDNLINPIFDFESNAFLIQ